jgi:hypothetical protein
MVSVLAMPEEVACTVLQAANAPGVVYARIPLIVDRSLMQASGELNFVAY